MKNTSFIIICIWFCVSMFFAKKYFEEREQLQKLLDEYEETLIKQKKTQVSLTNYFLLSLELNEICERFKSSREAKAKNKKLQEILNNID